MNQFIVLITGLHVLAHSIFGCCAHHTALAADGQAPQCCGASDRHIHAPENGGRHHAHDAIGNTEAVVEGGDESSHSPSRDHQCKHEHCKWVTSRGDTSTDLQGIAGNLTASVVTLSTIASLAMPVSGASAWESERCFAPALRSHLRLRVLLI